MTSPMDATVTAGGEQNNLKQKKSMKHQMGSKLTFGDFKAGNSAMLSFQLEVEHPFKTNSSLAVSLTPERKLGAQDKF
jgi:hypothetical protein